MIDLSFRLYNLPNLRHSNSRQDTLDVRCSIRGLHLEPIYRIMSQDLGTTTDPKRRLKIIKMALIIRNEGTMDQNLF